MCLNNEEISRKFKGRNYHIQAVAQAVGIVLNHVSDFDLTSLKATILPFGQLPYLVDGDIKLGQSNAILRYLARKGGIEGDSDADYALSEMLIEACVDIKALLRTAYRSGDKEASYDALFTPDSPL